MQLLQALRLSDTPRIAFVGAGGKTTAISILAKEISVPVIVTTTTHLGGWQTNIADRHIIIQSNSDLNKMDPEGKGITLLTQGLESDRLVGLNTERMNWVYEFCENHNLPLIIECDGSRQLPIKAPGTNEPVIPDFVDTVVVVSGLSGIERPLNKTVVHHPDIYSSLCDLPEGLNISIESQVRLLSHKKGGLKNIPLRARRLLLLNQVDTTSLQSQSFKLAKRLEHFYDGILVTELIKNRIHALFEPTAVIILAAGPSSRYGQPKQLLDYHGVPFIRSVTLSAINSHLSPIVVITGANSEPVSNVIQDLSSEIRIIHNPDWHAGQSTSIRVGIEALSKPGLNDFFVSPSGNIGSVIFLLADQPQVTPSIMLTLAEEHNRTLSPVIAPLINGKRGNPVLFDKVAFTELANLKGDIGGRGIFSKYPPSYIPWYDGSLSMDVDTPEDYERLLIG
jgi:molybdenum cofactor cytidylyltransferase